MNSWKRLPAELPFFANFCQNVYIQQDFFHSIKTNTAHYFQHFLYVLVSHLLPPFTAAFEWQLRVLSHADEGGFFVSRLCDPRPRGSDFFFF